MVITFYVLLVMILKLILRHTVRTFVNLNRVCRDNSVFNIVHSQFPLLTPYISTALLMIIAITLSLYIIHISLIFA